MSLSIQHNALHHNVLPHSGTPVTPRSNIDYCILFQYPWNLLQVEGDESLDLANLICQTQSVGFLGDVVDKVPTGLKTREHLRKPHGLH